VTVKYKTALYRILGNDLPPRHKVGQAYDNLKFILSHEPDFPNCRKKWVINRIADFKMEQKIAALLEKHKQPYVRTPFNFKDYKNCSGKKATAERHNKILYVMNNNGARNAALRDGKQIADWVLPFDGNCCFTAQGWKDVIDKLSLQKTTNKCFVVPMYRLKNNDQFFNFYPEKNVEAEPQVIFGRKSKCEFNESYAYGHDSKLELVRRLGFKTQPRANGTIVPDSEYRCGYVLRLFSGVKKGENHWKTRNTLREDSINLMIRTLDI